MAAEPRPHAKVRLTLETPQTLHDLRDFMAQSVTLGMPDHAKVECVAVPRDAIILTTYLEELGQEERD